MTRPPRDACEDAARPLAEGEVRALGRQLAARWAAAPRDEAPDLLPRLARGLERDAALVARAFPALAPRELHDIGEQQRDFLARDAARLLARVARGAVHTQPAPPLRLDAIRFEPGSGSWRLPEHDPPPAAGEPRDVAADLASLGLDLARAGRGDLAEALFGSFAAASGDFELYGVVDFYQRQQALARAAERTGEQGSRDGDEARQWLLVGLASNRRPLLPPALVAVGGLVASGKSTVARRLAARLGAPRLEADGTRDFLVRADPARGLAPDIEDVVYDELLRRARRVLESGRSVVLDACFPQRRQRTRARQLATAQGWPFLFVECRVDDETTRARLAERDAAAARPGWQHLYDDLARQWQPVDELPAREHLVLDGAGPLDESERQLEARLPLEPSDHRLP